LNRASHRQTLGYRVLASAMTAPLFEFYYQIIEAGLICVVNHNLGFIHCRKVTLFRSLLEPVATVAGHVADIGELRDKLPFCHRISFLGLVPAKTVRPNWRAKTVPPNLPENLLISVHFLKKYPQLYHRELPDYRFYLP